ncbi:MAG: PmoA family protein [Phycisphaerae bacterium]|nr:PmoA family protein [Phycisphaerae bacterium]
MAVSRGRLGVVLFAGVITCCVSIADGGEPTPFRVLILSGQNNHEWKQTTPALKGILEACKRFAVDVTDDPSTCATALGRYDVVVSNWTNWPDIEKRTWGPEMEKALAEFVRGGKGFALFHAASTPFQTWPEFQQLVGATWELGKTGHGKIHRFPVRIADKDHPITRGMSDFWMRDELWHQMKRQPEIHVLCEAFSSGLSGGSRQYEPVVLLTRFGKGRCFHLVLGHDVETMQNVAWQTLMLRGTEWAATGQVTIPIPANWPSTAATDDPLSPDVDADLREITKYTFGGSRGPQSRLERWVNHASTQPALRRGLAAKLAALVKPGAECTVEGKQFLCQQLSLIGSAAEIPLLASLLADEQLSLAARAALERIPGNEALSALRAAVSNGRGRELIGVINTLGNRRDAKAVEGILRHLNSSDEAVVGAAIDALGKIGGEQVAAALTSARDGLTAPLQRRLDDALLKCADGMASQGLGSKATTIYRSLAMPGKATYVRVAAYSGLLSCEKDDADKMLLAALAGEDSALRTAAIGHLRGAKADRGNERMVGLLGKALGSAAGPEAKRSLLEILGGVQSLEAMQLARGYLKDAALSDAASRAVLDIASRIGGSHKAETHTVLTEILASDPPEAIRQSALEVLLFLDKPANLALGGTASSPDGLEKDGAAGGDQAGIDGNPETYWDEQDDQKLYRFKVRFKQPTQVSAIRIIGYHRRDYSPKDFEILCDDKVAATVKDAKYRGRDLIVTFDRIQCSSLELKITGYYGRSPAIRELEIYDLAASTDARSSGYRWQQTSDSVVLLNDGRVVWQLNYGKQASKPCFHPVCLTDGTELTWLRPPDHVWHLGFWFAWKFIDGLNYWEEDKKTHLSEGRTEVTSVRVETRPEHSAHIEMALSYHPPDKSKVLTEKRVLDVTAPDPGGHYRIDWDSTFTAGEKDVVLNRTPPPDEKDGKSWGGYAGLSFRVAKDFRDWRVVDSEGRQGMDCHRKRARWLDWSGKVAGGKSAGVAMLDHPGNLRHPSPWFLVMTPKAPFGYFSPALLFEEPYTLPAGKTLRLRYRTLIHPGQGEASQIEAEWKEWSGR